jgi:ATP-dependent helicase YprA (DUF1998 family)
MNVIILITTFKLIRSNIFDWYSTPATTQASCTCTTMSKRRRRTQKNSTEVDASLATNRIVPLRIKDVSNLATLIKERVGPRPRSFQVEAVQAQLLRKDVVVHAGTGMGKALIAAGPHYHPAATRRLTIMVSPLLVLQTKQVSSCVLGSSRSSNGMK